MDEHDRRPGARDPVVDPVSVQEDAARPEGRLAHEREAMPSWCDVTREIAISGDMIRLGQLLKLAGVVGGGGELKDFLGAERVLVNGVHERRRGRQLHPGDLVETGKERLHVTGGG